jgi:YidC/Oxa1 family membrane protein insertase
MFGFLDLPVSGAQHIVTWFASLSQPLTGQLSVALAIVGFTVLVRLLLFPLSKAAARGRQGCLPMLLQIPFFMIMYQLFSSTLVHGEPNSLLAGSLFGTPLGDHFHGPVFIGLAVLLAVVAWFSSRWQAKMMERSGSPEVPGGKLMRFLPYGTVLATAFVPLAAGVYLLTTTAWTVAERAILLKI